jgi:hypothetical protein
MANECRAVDAEYRNPGTEQFCILAQPVGSADAGAEIE